MPLRKICGKEKTNFTPAGIRHHICNDCKVLPKEKREEMRTLYLLREMPMVLSSSRRKWLRKIMETSTSEEIRKVALEEYKKRYLGHRGFGLDKTDHGVKHQ